MRGLRLGCGALSATAVHDALIACSLEAAQVPGQGGVAGEVTSFPLTAPTSTCLGHGREVRGAHGRLPFCNVNTHRSVAALDDRCAFPRPRVALTPLRCPHARMRLGRCRPNRRERSPASCTPPQADRFRFTYFAVLLLPTPTLAGPRARGGGAARRCSSAVAPAFPPAVDPRKLIVTRSALPLPCSLQAREREEAARHDARVLQELNTEVMEGEGGSVCIRLFGGCVLTGVRWACST